MTSRVDCANAPLFNTDRAKEYFGVSEPHFSPFTCAHAP